MSSSNYAPSQNDSLDQEMLDLIADQDFLDPEPNETTEAISSVLSSSAMESTSEEILDSFSCKPQRQRLPSPWLRSLYLLQIRIP